MEIAAFNEDLIYHPIVLFDGVCNLCNGFVDFILRRDTHGVFRFASLQSAIGREFTTSCQNNLWGMGSVVLVEEGKCYVKSTAALRIIRRLQFPWFLGYVFIIFPKVWRDIVYDTIARNRYRWFGKRDTCRLPTAVERARFLE
jgi:predicted DCC family thiol-disulfide oxidoreductase YuxK